MALQVPLVYRRQALSFLSLVTGGISMCAYLLKYLPKHNPIPRAATLVFDYHC